jgi:transcriptional regulator
MQVALTVRLSGPLEEAPVYIAPVDQSLGEEEWRPFVESQGFGHFVARGNGEYPVVVPSQFVLDGDEILAHFVARNAIFDALQADPRAVLSVAGDWAFIPSAWKAIDDEDPLLGIPTTYYAAVQLRGRVEVLEDPARVASILRRQLGAIQPDIPAADPEEAHLARLRTIHAIVLHVEEVSAKFKYGGNVDEEHRRAVIRHLEERRGPGDAAAARHTARRLEATRLRERDREA